MKVVDEKLMYGDRRKTPFGWGYFWGVRTYRKYSKASSAEREIISGQIDDYKDEARNGKGRSRECAVGFLYGMRDATSERSNRYR